MWGVRAWDNDRAADWYGAMMDKTQLREIWLEGINKDAMQSPTLVRAAAGLFLMLGHVYVWPINDYNKDLKLTIKQLGIVTENKDFQEMPELIAVIKTELVELESRLA